MPPVRSVSIVLPAYNNRDLLARNLPFVLAEAERRGCGDEVIVADDAGQDDTRELLASAFPAVRYVRNAVNGGFGAACNAGIAVSRCPYVMLLNTDVRISAGLLDPLLRHFDDPDVFSVSPHVIRPGEPSVCQSMIAFSYDAGHFQLLWDEAPAAEQPTPVIYSSGACAVYDAVKLRALGGVDPLFRPFYWEDVDLGYSAWKRGWRCLYEPAVSVLHEESVTVRTRVSSSQKAVIEMRNYYLFVWKNISDPAYFATHVATLLPRAASALVRRQYSLPLRGLCAALPRAREALSARSRARRASVRTDRELAAAFAASAASIRARMD